MLTDPRGLRELTADEALRRLGGVPVGRIVFTSNALPTIRPVNHRLVDGAVVLRCHGGAAVLGAVGQVVAYEADEIDLASRLAWSVIATGIAGEVSDPDELAQLERLVEPWLAHDMTHTIRIRPQLVTGFEVIAADQPTDARHPPPMGESMLAQPG
ncbi:pyridoxamine 5'-phosphate oxidase family protein [Kribbella sp. HUAS MG21]|jgi:hypothetical protein|uniref:Pyridoxamine 5'-phosphate oxidase family protein n=1 Tax=Kribbella sp. HUAS MG21 TaxID=3160966 RepID=A0AAU7T828_9ACTN